jgi:hypothetical protein
MMVVMLVVSGTVVPVARWALAIRFIAASRKRWCEASAIRSIGVSAATTTASTAAAAVATTTATTTVATAAATGAGRDQRDCHHECACGAEGLCERRLHVPLLVRSR